MRSYWTTTLLPKFFTGRSKSTITNHVEIMAELCVGLNTSFFNDMKRYIEGEAQRTMHTFVDAACVLGAQETIPCDTLFGAYKTAFNTGPQLSGIVPLGRLSPKDFTSELSRRNVYRRRRVESASDITLEYVGIALRV